MAQKRMFSKSITETDRFRDMPTSAQALYFHLGIQADDDGFVASPKGILRAIGCNADDLSLLIAKGYAIGFDSGVIVLTDWRTNNLIRSDRYQPTIYTEEKAALQMDETGRYHLLDTNGIPTVSKRLPQVRLGENRLEMGDKPPAPANRKRFIPPTMEDVQAYIAEKGYRIDPQRFIDHYEANGWRVGRNPMKSWQAAVRTWAKNEYSSKREESTDPWSNAQYLT